MANSGTDRIREDEEFDKAHPGKRKAQIMAFKKRKEALAKRIK